jgi:integrase
MILREAAPDLTPTDIADAAASVSTPAPAPAAQAAGGGRHKPPAGPIAMASDQPPAGAGGSGGRRPKAKSVTHFAFTEAALERLRGPGPNDACKSIEYSDMTVSGLKVEVGRSGKGTYLYRYTHRGTKRGMRLGTVGAIPLAEVRRLALAARAELDRGNDPQDERDRIKAMPTFEEFVTQQYLPWVASAKTRTRDDASRSRHHLIDRWGRKRLCDVTTRDVDMLKTALLGHRSAGTTNRVLHLARAIFRQAIAWGVVDRNPCDAVKPAKEKTPAPRYLSPDEVGRLLIALDADKNQVAVDALKLLLFTGCRREEILQLPWSAVSLPDGTLKLEKTKNGEIRWVQLSSEAIELLKRQPSQGVSRWVFPGRDGPDRPINNVRKTLERAQQAAGLEAHVHIHALRHSAASLAVRAGVPIYTVQGMLGHKTARMTQRYAHLADDTVRAGSQAVADVVTAALAAARAKREENGEGSAGQAG